MNYETIEAVICTAWLMSPLALWLADWLNDRKGGQA